MIDNIEQRDAQRLRKLEAKIVGFKSKIKRGRASQYEIEELEKMKRRAREIRRRNGWG